MYFDAYRSFVDSACSRNNPIEDDLVLKVGNRGRNKGEFTNPQGVAMSPDGKPHIFWKPKPTEFQTESYAKLLNE